MCERVAGDPGPGRVERRRAALPWGVGPPGGRSPSLTRPFRADLGVRSPADERAESCATSNGPVHGHPVIVLRVPRRSHAGTGGYAHRMRLSRITVRSRSPRDTARFWGGVLGGDPVEDEQGGLCLALPGLPAFLFERVPEGRSVPGDGALGGGSLRLDLELGPSAEGAVRARAGALNGIVPQGVDGGGQVPSLCVRDPEGNQLRFFPPPTAPSPSRPCRPEAMAKVRVLFTDDRDRILLVRLKTPGQGLGWGLPGGTVEAGEETPREAAAREVAEELGLDRPAGRLLSVDWVNRPEDRPRTVQVFDGGRLGAGDLARIRLDEEELAEWRLCSSSEAEALLPAAPRGQLRQSLAVLAQGTGPVELVDGVLAGH